MEGFSTAILSNYLVTFLKILPLKDQSNNIIKTTKTIKTIINDKF